MVYFMDFTTIKNKGEKGLCPQAVSSRVRKLARVLTENSYA